ncbi:MAG: peptide-binding protein [Candidatus Hydrogenedentales bacterium]|jgi:peptide/nickel transport system substrate-binding protein
MRSSLSGFALLLLFAAAVAGCGQAGDEKLISRGLTPLNSLVSEATNDSPVDGDWIVFRLPAEPGHLNILLDTADSYGNQVCSTIFETLLERDNRTMEWKPLLAESWEISDDHLSYTFHVRKDATFSDGAPITAQDVKFTLDLIQNPANETADLRNYYQDVTSTELLDDYTIRFHCSKPYFRHLDMLGGGIPVYPKHVYAGQDFNKHPNNRLPVGSGQYTFEKWETNRQIVLTRNENYWNKDRIPHIKKQAFQIITDDDVSFQVLSQEGFDWGETRPEQWVTRMATPEFSDRFYKYSTVAPPGYATNFAYIAWNMRDPRFQDKRVRQALTMLLDRQTILDTIFEGLGQVVSGSESTMTPEYDASIKPWPFDPERAKALLAEAGWADTDGDGILDKDGRKFEFVFLFPEGRKEYVLLATVFKQELEYAGIRMTISPREWASFLESVTKRSFDAMSLSWALPYNTEPYQIWHSTQTEKGSNYPGFKNAEADQILDSIRLEFDRSKRIELNHRLHAILHEEQPYTFLFNRYILYATSKRFRDIYVYSKGADQTEWWVPKGLQRYE